VEVNSQRKKSRQLQAIPAVGAIDFRHSLIARERMRPGQSRGVRGTEVQVEVARAKSYRRDIRSSHERQAAASPSAEDQK
jgi:hypothetical protein